jgi:ribosomal RNA assembly protein
MTELVVRIPEERLAVIIGTGGTVKKAIEAKSGARLTIDTTDGSVTVRAPPEVDPWGALKARDVVLAVGRGFSPERAFRLFQGENYLSVLDMKDISGKRTKDAMRRLRSRLIGERGAARSRVEELSGCSVSIYGTSVALIGSAEQLDRGEHGIRLLLRGSEHGAVYSYLERARLRGLMAPEPGGSGGGAARTPRAPAADKGSDDEDEDELHLA